MSDRARTFINVKSCGENLEILQHFILPEASDTALLSRNLLNVADPGNSSAVGFSSGRLKFSFRSHDGSKSRPK